MQFFGTRIWRRFNPARAKRLQKLLAIRRWDKQAFASYDQSMMAMIGTMTVTWAGIEMILKQFIAWYHVRGGKAISREFPRMFTRKISYLASLERDIRWTYHQRETFREIRAKLTELNEFRSNMIHGYVYRRNRRNLSWRVLIHREQSDKLVRHEISYSNIEIAVALQDMSDLADRMSATYAPILGLSRTTSTHKSSENVR